METIDRSEYTGEVVTWTTGTATPPGVREPNALPVVEFAVGEASDDVSSSRTQSGDEGETVRAIGQVTTDDVETGDEVRFVRVEELREPDAGIRESGSRVRDGYRFEPV